MDRMYDLGINHKLPPKIKGEFHIRFDDKKSESTGEGEPNIIIVDKSHIDKLVNRELIMNRLRLHDPFFENQIEDKSYAPIVPIVDKKRKVNFEKEYQVLDKDESEEESDKDESDESDESEEKDDLSVSPPKPTLIPIEIPTKKGKKKKGEEPQ